MIICDMVIKSYWSQVFSTANYHNNKVRQNRFGAYGEKKNRILHGSLQFFTLDKIVDAADMYVFYVAKKFYPLTHFCMAKNETKNITQVDNNSLRLSQTTVWHGHICSTVFDGIKSTFFTKNSLPFLFEAIFNKSYQSLSTKS